MESRFLEVIKDMGVFLLCIRSLMHFSAGKSYEKYIRMLSGLVIMMQLTIPVTQLYSDTSADELWKEVEYFETELAQNMEACQQGMPDTDTIQTEQIWKQEVMDRLQQQAAEYGFCVTDVILREESQTLCICLSLQKQTTEEIRITPIHIGETPDGNTQENMPHMELPEALKEAFAKLLGTDTSCLEFCRTEE